MRHTQQLSCRFDLHETMLVVGLACVVLLDWAPPFICHALVILLGMCTGT